MPVLFTGRRGVIAFALVFGVSSLVPILGFAAEEFKVGLVLDRGGKDDKSFNSAAYEGCTKAEKELKIQLRTVEAKDGAAMEAQLRNMAVRKFDLIAAIGFAQADAVKKIAAQFPDRHFVIVDSQVALPNVQSLMFAEHQGAFLMGVIAAMTSKTGKIGFVGGMDIPLIHRFKEGYEAGAKYALPKATVLSNFVGLSAEAWTNPAKAKELTLNQYNAGADVVFGAAGASTMGLFDAAEEKKRFAIGVDSNQNGAKPGRVLTSMLKRVDVAIFESIKNAKEGKFKAGVMNFDLSNGGVDFAQDEHNKGLIDAKTLAKVAQVRKDIASGKIKVPDVYAK